MQPDKISRIAVIGAGSWGTTLANLLAEKGLSVDLWVREDEVHEQILKERVNREFLPDVKLSARIQPVRSYEEALEGKEVVLIVVPSHVFREVLEGMRPSLREGVALVSATKGIENQSLLLMSQVADEVLTQPFRRSFACLAGPSFAREVSRKVPTVITIASRDETHAASLQQLLSTDFFRVYFSTDLIGVQVAGALKNVIAIAAGTSDGLQFGHNARAGLITRGLAEITRLGVAMGANPLTLAGLAGLGDLVLTCTGDLSRNRTVGLKIGQGLSLQEITGSMKMVAEGIRTTKAAHALARKMGVEMPITAEVYRILYEGKDPRDAVRDLMTRELKAEIEH
ncbi:MAG: NAD(P)-dependent glycerol-3-phosphate dehydrogenase [Deltaproteobacteria bacterium]|nr:NAD(P)-dependent glycerol-3-phosphate dehydrogenase [Deltaproteobacteria bacterium]MBW1922406.1 NAD(P)-dependent glycerol-3-phosphate dehydrogenase [Deltaproteobacteria bacterium]MBW1948442.1 NAD(P)-dependent glycerol-3-phosphate dehydrogenase [Deltaproteobacteria bacterium]MBW2009269.1 NAD(P)-dependent glycerol-3-phosphate dehydrogenase [Deltaproteobacteria bacterium]MBW2103633.1 NAD(P)-dependent glycerol-3-phosphate dehydrogenase [Deltaproteobacteria bacterium]